MANYLVALSAAIINSSLCQGIVPNQWQISRITPTDATHVSHWSDVSPIAVTNTIAKIAEKFVCEHFNHFYDTQTDINQFGYVHNWSTTHALLKVMHEILVASNCSEKITRILFVDFRKAFDLTDHHILFNKLLTIARSLAFLNDRKQLSKLVTLYLLQLQLELGLLKAQYLVLMTLRLL